ncbi:MAG: DNA polymerase IV [Bifidobacteriaceae bacterium]|jgi:DNA polymerase-4|nr:DNA polymerase IV [Bifidobacteriaceae bacterium]
MSTSPRSQAVKRDWGHDETGCTVLHIDMDAFYASCEIARHPELKGKPVIIGTGNRAVVSAASYEARAYGINSAMAVATARRKCPQGIYLPVDMAYYRATSRKIFALIATVTDQIEQVSVDEAYVNVASALLLWHEPTAIARWIRATVHDRFNVTCSVGIATNKLIAKLASTNAKPDGMLLVPASRNAEFIQMLPLRSLPGVGPASAERFRRWGVETVAQLADLSESELVQITGSKIHAHDLLLAAQGRDERKVTPHTPEKSIGAERTFMADTTDVQTVSNLLRRSSEEVAASLRTRGLVARTVTTKLRFDDLSYATKALTLTEPLDSAAVIFPTARKLLFAMLHMAPDVTELPRAVRLAGVSTSGLSPSKTTALQPALDFDVNDEAPALTATPDNGTASADTVRRRQEGSAKGSRTGSTRATTTADLERLRTAEKTLDSIRTRYGKGSIHLGLG